VRCRGLSHFATASAVMMFSFAVLFLFCTVTAGQNGSSTPRPDRVVTNEELDRLYLALSVAKLPTPRASDGHPDLSGFYYNVLSATGKRNADGTIIFGFGNRSNTPPPKYPEPNEPSYKPEYWAKVKAIVDNQYGSATPDDPNFDCKPSGVPRVSTGPLQIVQTPKLIVILYESNFISETFRLIYTDGRPHPKPEDVDPSYYGDSIGHWEGDTLVVDVIGLNDETWLGGAQGHTEPPAFGESGNHQIIEKYALIHSDQEHIIERYTRHGNMLTYEATVEDPVMFTKAWVLTPRHLILRPPDDRFLETFCQVESTDKNHLVRPTQDDRFKPEDERFNRPGDSKK
jgi:hypothetical protein